MLSSESSTARLTAIQTITSVAMRHSLKECDATGLATLSHAGLLKDYVPPELAERTLGALRDGPLVRAERAIQAAVLFVPDDDYPEKWACSLTLDHVMSLRQEVREAALSHLDRNRAHLSPYSRDVVTEQRSALLSPDIRVWFPAALQLDKVVGCDFKWNMTGLCLALDIDNKALLDRFRWLTLTQGVRSLLSIADDRYELLKDASLLEQEVRSLVEGASSVEELLENYDKRFGHLRLATSFGMGTVVSSWLARHPGLNITSALKRWCGQGAMPLRIPDVIAVSLCNPSAIDAQYAAELEDIAGRLLSGNAGGKVEGVCAAALSLEAELARYFWMLIENHVSSIDGDRIASLSWWASRRVVELLVDVAGDYDDAAAFLTFMQEEFLGPLQGTVHLLWQLAWSDTEASPSRAGAIRLRPYPLEALGQQVALLGSQLSAISPVSRPAATGVLQRLTRWGQTEKVNTTSICFFDEPIPARASEWACTVVTTAEHDAFMRGLAVTDNARSSEWMLGWLKGNTSLDQAEAERVASAFCDGVLQDRKRYTALWAAFTAPEFAKLVLRRLPSRVFEQFGSGLVELARHHDELETKMLPHVFAELCVDDAVEPEVRRLSFIFALVTATCTGETAAIRRLAEEPKCDHKWLADWKGLLETLLVRAPDSMKGRLRDVLASLSGGAVGAVSGNLLPSPEEGDKA